MTDAYDPTVIPMHKRVPLPDAGLSAAQIDALEPRLRRATVQTARADGRYDLNSHNILPLHANGNGGSNGAGVQAATLATPADGGAGAGAGVGAGGGQAPPPIFGQPMPAGMSRTALPIVWMAETRKQATEQCGAALAIRAERLYRRGKALAILDLPDPAENAGNEELERKGKAFTTVDLTLRRARIARASDLKRQVDEADILFRGPTRGPRPKDGSAPKTAPIHPPMDPLEAIIADVRLCPARRLVGIAHVPYMDRQGVLDMTEGYNPRTGIFHDLTGLATLKIPDQPTENDAKAAVGVLFHPFDQYENYTGRERDEKLRFVGEVLTCQFSSIERVFLERAPMLIVNGIVAGLGKGEFCHAMTCLAYGAKGDIINAGESDEEFDKRIDSVLIDGPPVFIIDNLNDHLLTNNTLATYSTEGRTHIRAYGRKGGDIEVEGRALIFINGNKLMPSRDNNRRCFTVSLFSKSENPESRHFSFHPAEEVMRTRTAMLEAAYTIMRWWRQRSMPKSGKVLGSFETWSNRVGDMVAALTGWHPVASIGENSKRDLFRQRQSQAIAALSARFSLGGRLRSSDVANIAAAVLKARRENTRYVDSIMPTALDQRLHPAFWAALAAHKAADAALQAMVKSGAAGGKPGTPAAAAYAALVKHEKDKSELLRLATEAARLHQAELDTDLAEAIEAATPEGKVTSNAIGRWFATVEDKPVDGLVLVRDKQPGAKMADVVVVEY